MTLFCFIFEMKFQLSRPHLQYIYSETLAPTVSGLTLSSLFPYWPSDHGTPCRS